MINKYIYKKNRHERDHDRRKSNHIDASPALSTLAAVEIHGKIQYKHDVSLENLQRKKEKRMKR